MLLQTVIAGLERNANGTKRSGIDIIAFSADALRFIGIQVKALSKRNRAPRGPSLERCMGDFRVIVNKVASENPICVRSEAVGGKSAGSSRRERWKNFQRATSETRRSRSSRGKIETLPGAKTRHPFKPGRSD